MELSKVRRILTPKGSLERILSGDVVIWQKPTGNKYKILVDNKQVAEVTMTQFVKAIHNGDARTDWGIGAQIIVPYYDAWTNKNYELPFNFGTFTAYGTGKLGLQTAKSIPGGSQPYGNKGSCTWNDSYVKKWLNTEKLTGNITGVSYVWGRQRMFLSSIPQDFRDHVIYQPNIDSYFFLLSSSQFNAKTVSGDIQNNGSPWTYWINKAGSEKQEFDTINSNRKIIQLPYIANDTPRFYATMTMRKANNGYSQYAFDKNTGWYYSCGTTISMTYLPACVIG